VLKKEGRGKKKEGIKNMILLLESSFFKLLPSIMSSHREQFIWQRAVQLAILCYQLTNNFPKSELYGLTNQMRRAAVSVPSNIAEGYGLHEERRRKEERRKKYPPLKGLRLNKDTVFFRPM
jgi:hypothetical protein